jgi:hypothetical protein
MFIPVTTLNAKEQTEDEQQNIYIYVYPLLGEFSYVFWKRGSFPGL